MLKRVQQHYQHWYATKHPDHVPNAKTDTQAIQKTRETLAIQDFNWSGRDPLSLDQWEGNKRLDFERKKMIMLLNFFVKERERLTDEPHAINFLRDYGQGEL